MADKKGRGLFGVNLNPFGKATADGKKKPTRVKLGESNKFVFDKNLNMWVELGPDGKAIIPETNTAPPPRSSSLGDFLLARQSEPGSEASQGRESSSGSALLAGRLGARARYVDTGHIKSSASAATLALGPVKIPTVGNNASPLGAPGGGNPGVAMFMPGPAAFLQPREDEPGSGAAAEGAAESPAAPQAQEWAGDGAGAGEGEAAAPAESGGRSSAGHASRQGYSASEPQNMGSDLNYASGNYSVDQSTTEEGPAGAGAGWDIPPTIQIPEPEVVPPMDSTMVDESTAAVADTSHADGWVYTEHGWQYVGPQHPDPASHPEDPSSAAAPDLPTATPDLPSGTAPTPADGGAAAAAEGGGAASSRASPSAVDIDDATLSTWRDYYRSQGYDADDHTIRGWIMYYWSQQGQGGGTPDSRGASQAPQEGGGEGGEGMEPEDTSALVQDAEAEDRVSDDVGLAYASKKSVAFSADGYPGHGRSPDASQAGSFSTRREMSFANSLDMTTAMQGPAGLSGNSSPSPRTYALGNLSRRGTGQSVDLAPHSGGRSSERSADPLVGVGSGQLYGEHRSAQPRRAGSGAKEAADMAQEILASGGDAGDYPHSNPHTSDLYEGTTAPPRTSQGDRLAHLPPASPSTSSTPRRLETAEAAPRGQGPLFGDAGDAGAAAVSDWAAGGTGDEAVAFSVDPDQAMEPEPEPQAGPQFEDDLDSDLPPFGSGLLREREDYVRPSREGTADPDLDESGLTGAGSRAPSSAALSPSKRRRIKAVGKINGPLPWEVEVSPHRSAQVSPNTSPRRGAASKNAEAIKQAGQDLANSAAAAAAPHVRQAVDQGQVLLEKSLLFGKQLVEHVQQRARQEAAKTMGGQGQGQASEDQAAVLGYAAEEQARPQEDGMPSAEGVNGLEADGWGESEADVAAAAAARVAAEAEASGAAHGGGGEPRYEAGVVVKPPPPPILNGAQVAGRALNEGLNRLGGMLGGLAGVVQTALAEAEKAAADASDRDARDAAARSAGIDDLLGSHRAREQEEEEGAATVGPTADGWDEPLEGEGAADALGAYLVPAQETSTGPHAAGWEGWDGQESGSGVSGPPPYVPPQEYAAPTADGWDGDGWGGDALTDLVGHAGAAEAHADAHPTGDAPGLGGFLHDASAVSVSAVEAPPGEGWGGGDWAQELDLSAAAGQPGPAQSEARPQYEEPSAQASAAGDVAAAADGWAAAEEPLDLQLAAAAPAVAEGDGWAAAPSLEAEGDGWGAAEIPIPAYATEAAGADGWGAPAADYNEQAGWHVHENPAAEVEPTENGWHAEEVGHAQPAAVEMAAGWEGAETNGEPQANGWALDLQLEVPGQEEEDIPALASAGTQTFSVLSTEGTQTFAVASAAATQTLGPVRDHTAIQAVPEFATGGTQTVVGGATADSVCQTDLARGAVGAEHRPVQTQTSFVAAQATTQTEVAAGPPHPAAEPEATPTPPPEVLSSEEDTAATAAAAAAIAAAAAAATAAAEAELRAQGLEARLASVEAEGAALRQAAHDAEAAAAAVREEASKAAESVRDLQRKCKVLTKKVKALEGTEARAAEVERGAAEARAAFESRVSELEAQLSAHAASDAKLAELDGTLAATRAQVAILESELSAALAAGDAAGVEAAELRDRVGELEYAYQAVAMERDRLQSEAVASAPQLEAALRGAEEAHGRVGELEAELIAVQAEAASLRAERDSLAAEVGALRSEIEALRAAQAAQAAQQQQTSAGEEEAAALRDRLSVVEKEKADLLRAAKGLKKKALGLEAQLKAAEERAAAAAQAPGMVESPAPADGPSIDDLEAAHAATEAAQMERDAALSEAALANERVAALTAELASVRESARDMEAAADDARVAAEGLREGLAAAEALAESLRAETAAAREAAAAAEAQSQAAAESAYAWNARANEWEAAAAAAQEAQAMAESAALAAQAAADEAAARLAAALEQSTAAVPSHDLEAETAALRSKAGQLESEVQEAQEAAAAKDTEFAELLACLGQEGEKVRRLAALLEERGVDVGPILDAVEAEYGFEGEGGEEEGGQGDGWAE